MNVLNGNNVYRQSIEERDSIVTSCKLVEQKKQNKLLGCCRTEYEAKPTKKENESM